MKENEQVENKKSTNSGENGQKSKKSADKSAEATAVAVKERKPSGKTQAQKKEQDKISRPRSGRQSEAASKVLAENMGVKGHIDRAELQEVYKNAVLGMESVEDLRPLSGDKAFRNLLLKQYGRYAAVAKDVEIYASEHGLELNDPSLFAKGMMKMSTTFNTLNDKSNSKLAQIMVQGINMGIVSVTKVINRLSDEHRTNEYADKMLELLQTNLNEMKLFL